MSLLRQLFLLVTAAVGLSKSTSLENNPFRMRNLFLAELKIRQQLLEIRHHRGTDPEIDDEIAWFMYTHDIAVGDLREAGIRDINHLEALGDDGVAKVDQLLVGNPLHIYSLVRRCLHFVNPIVEHLQTLVKTPQQSTCARDGGDQCFDEAEDFEDPIAEGYILRDLWSIRNGTYWPDDDDLGLAALAIARLQHVYQLDALEFASGKIGDRETDVQLMADDCQYIAEERMEQNYPMVPTSTLPEYAVAIEWLEAGLNLSTTWYGADAAYTKFIREKLIDVRAQHDTNFRAPEEGDGPSLAPNEMFFIRPIGKDLSVTGRMLRLEEWVEFRRRNAGMHKDDGHTYSRRDFFALCRGEAIKVNGHKPRVNRCFYQTRNNPLFLIQPLKVEVVGGHPLPVVIFREALTDRQVELLKQSIVAKGTLSGAKVFNTSDPGAGDHISTDRTQTTGWLFEKDHPQLIPLARRLDHVSGLQVSFEKDASQYTRFVESEDFQLGVYGPGGLYLCHKDSLSVESIKWHNTTDANTFVGDRIATLMLYLSDVDGGNTAFPHVGAFATPAKGSAVFWYNLGHDSSEDRNSLHGGCPVLYGMKWVSNKWIREGSQLFKRPCGLEKWKQLSIANFTQNATDQK